MPALLRCLFLALALAAGGSPAAVADKPDRSQARPQVRVDPSFPPLLGGPRLAPPAARSAPRGYGYGGYRDRRPQIYCDGYGRCFDRLPDRSFGYRRGYDAYPQGRGDGAYDGRSPNDSLTHRYFGSGAARRLY